MAPHSASDRNNRSNNSNDEALQAGCSQVPALASHPIISSVNGTPFVAAALRNAIAWLQTRWKLGYVYHPQSQSMVERVNGNLKSKIVKISRQTGLNWVDALPLALMLYRIQTHSETHLTTHEMLTGRPRPTPILRGPHEGPALDQVEGELRAYVK